MFLLKKTLSLLGATATLKLRTEVMLIHSMQGVAEWENDYIVHAYTRLTTRLYQKDSNPLKLGDV